MKHIICAAFFFLFFVVMIPCNVFAATKKKTVSVAEMQQQMEALDKIDLLNKMEIQDLLDSSRMFAMKKDFSNAALQLNNAEKIAVDSKDKQAVASARVSLDAEIKRYSEGNRRAGKNR